MTVLAGTKVIPQLLADTRDLIAAAWRTADDDVAACRRFPC